MGRNLNCYVVIADRKGGSQTRRLNVIIAVEEINVLHVSGDQFMLNVRCDVTYVFNRLAVLNCVSAHAVHKRACFKTTHVAFRTLS